MIRTTNVCLIAMFAFFAESKSTAADNWPQFRGPHGNGIAPDQKLGPVEFGPGKNELWKVQVSPGLSSPCIWGNCLFLTGCDANAKKFETICLDRNDGRVLWRTAVTAEALEPVHKTSSPATATPICDGERVYVYFASFGLVAYTMDGEKAWELPLPMPGIMFGSGTSPTLVGDLIILNRMQVVGLFGQATVKTEKGEQKKPASEIIAVDRRTGQVTWRTPMTFASPLCRSHMTPAACTDKDNQQVIIAGGGRITALDASTGKSKWWIEGLPTVATASPTIAGDRLYLNCTGAPGDVDQVSPPTYEQALEKWDANKDGKLQKEEIPEEVAVWTRHRADREGDFSLKSWFFSRADTNRDGALSKEEWDRLFEQSAKAMAEAMKPAMVSVKLGGEGNVTETHTVWKSHKGVPEVPTMLVVGKLLFAVRNGGLVTCFDADSGKIQFEERLGPSGSYYASPISDGTHIYFISQPGIVTVLRASDKSERLARNDMEDEVGATPALVDGKLYLRTGKHLYAFCNVK